MSPEPEAHGILAILLDVEGTTTPIEFIHKTLFSYARQQMQSFLHSYWEDPEVRADIDGLRNHRLDKEKTPQTLLWQEYSDAALQNSVLTYANWLMDSDSKCTPLKSLQGRIWQEGYAGGRLKSEVYADVPAAFPRWSREGKIISIFSSGSVLAQRLLFANTASGDLTPFITRYFDTTTGPKRAAESYGKIAVSLGVPARSVLFVSDTIGELDAAAQATMQTALCVREKDVAPATSKHKLVRTFDEL